MKTKRKSLPLLTALVGLSAPASGSLVIYEPFDYPATDTDSNDGAFLGDGSQGGGLGLGTWNGTTTNNELEIVSPGMGYTDGVGNSLVVSGAQAYRTARVGQATANSPVDAAATAALTGDGSTMWMSFLFRDGGFSGPTSALMLASETMVTGDAHNLSAPGYGVGVVIRATANPDRAIHTAYYDNSTSYTLQAAANPDFNGPGASDPFLLAAKVNWNPDGTPDEIYVFNITDLTTEPDEADALASDTFDMSLANQQSLGILNIGETQIDGFDEIRFGTTFASVTPIPEPSALTLLGLAGGLLMSRRRS